MSKMKNSSVFTTVATLRNLAFLLCHSVAIFQWPAWDTGYVLLMISKATCGGRYVVTTKKIGKRKPFYLKTNNKFI